MQVWCPPPWCMGGYLVTQLCPTLCDCSPPDSSVHEISREEYWSGLPFPPPGALPDPGDQNLGLLYWQVDSLPLHHLGSHIYGATYQSPQSKEKSTLCKKGKRSQEAIGSQKFAGGIESEHYCNFFFFWLRCFSLTLAEFLPGK